MNSSIRFAGARATRRTTHWVRIASVAILLAGLVFTGMASALTIKPYSEKAVAVAQAKGAATALLFHADWCPTCRAQEKTLKALEKSSKRDIMVFFVKYDKEKELRGAKKVRAQSTLIVYRGKAETGRMAGETSAAAITAALESAYKK